MGINRDNIKLSQLRTLVAVAESGNFGEAGIHLGVSQSAVSHAIATLEADLGVVLFVRGRHGARLTPVGEKILRHAQAMLGLLEAIDREAALAKGLQGGEVRVASFRSIATHVLPEVIADFRKTYPAIALSLTEYRGDYGSEHALREGRVDVGFTCLPLGDEFESWELFRDEYVVLFPPTVTLPDRPLTWEDLAAYPMILPPETDYCSVLIRDHFARLQLPLSAAYHITEDSTIVGMVTRGLGITIMTRLAAEPLPAQIQVRPLPTPLERVICVTVLANALHPPAVYAFLDTLKAHLKNTSHPLLKRPVYALS